MGTRRTSIGRQPTNGRIIIVVWHATVHRVAKSWTRLSLLTAIVRSLDCRRLGEVAGEWRGDLCSCPRARNGDGGGRWREEGRYLTYTCGRTESVNRLNVGSEGKKRIK